jgi:hypothetical protein
MVCRYGEISSLGFRLSLGTTNTTRLSETRPCTAQVETMGLYRVTERGTRMTQKDFSS